MLILLRGPGDEVIIKAPGYDDIVLKFLRCEDGVTRVGFEADDRIIIMRSELLRDYPDAAERFTERQQNRFATRPAQPRERATDDEKRTPYRKPNGKQKFVPPDRNK